MAGRFYPGGLTYEEWRTVPLQTRIDLIRRAQCDLLGSFRFCTNKTCRRARTCSGDDSFACRDRLWSRVKPKPKTLLREWSRIENLKAV